MQTGIEAGVATTREERLGTQGTSTPGQAAPADVPNFNDVTPRRRGSRRRPPTPRDCPLGFFSF